MLRMPQAPSRTYILEREQAAYESRVRLWLAGFSAQDIVSTEEIVAAVDRVPDHQLEGLRGVIYDPERATQDLDAYSAPWGFNVKGAFFRVERCIVLYHFASKSRFEHILYHEIGHYVFQYILDSYQRQNWVTRIYPRSRHVTQIAGRNANEDFAESYAAFLRNRPHLLQIPQKHAFMRNEVFRAQ